MYIIGRLVCLVRMCCVFGTPGLGVRNQQNTMFYQTDVWTPRSALDETFFLI